MEMKNIFKYAVIATALSAGIFSCSEDEFAKDEQNSQVVSVGGLKIQVGDFPSESLRSSVPGFEAGKSAWANGDQIKLTISFDGGKAESSTIEYQNGSWSTSSLPPYPSSDSKIELVAEYSSDRSYKANGVSEYFKYTYSGSASQPIKISFTRNYSRLRVWAGDNENKLTLTSGYFYLNGGINTAANGVTASKSFENENVNNVFFYGSWEKDAVLEINGKEFTMTEASVEGKSYAIDLQKGSSVTVECNHIIVAKGQQITETDIMNALRCKDDTIFVEGVLDDQLELSRFFDMVTTIARMTGKRYTLDLTGWEGISKLTGMYRPYCATLLMPKSIKDYGSASINARGVIKLVISNEVTNYGDDFFPSFENAASTSLELKGDARKGFSGGLMWANVIWLDITLSE